MKRRGSSHTDTTPTGCLYSEVGGSECSLPGHCMAWLTAKRRVRRRQVTRRQAARRGLGAAARFGYRRKTICDWNFEFTYRFLAFFYGSVCFYLC